MDAGPNRLLVIDDNLDFCNFVRNVAQECGYAAAIAGDARDFMTKYSAFKPTVIVVDLAMPEVDGIELLRFLSDSECDASLLIVSGFDPTVLEAAARLGVARGLRMAGTLSKPVRVAQLDGVLRSLSMAEQPQ